MHSPVKIALLGLGTVGRGVYRILTDNAENIAHKVGAPLIIARILVRDPHKDRGLEVDRSLLTGDFSAILEDPDIAIIVEVMGGIHPALDYALAALERGKSLVTANKDMIALHGRELFAAAEASGADLLFEGSVAGGIPIIRPLKQCLAANRIQEIMGIINGTTNFMLTRMTLEGADFHQVLQEAQARGYAEADPSADIEGLDAARKLAILASIAFNSRITINDVYVEGISRITARDIAYAGELNYVIKLLGIARETPEGIEVRVHPTMVPKSHPLAAVNDVFNAIFVRGDAVGETMFYGRGAGEMPTGSAVAADVMDAARNILHKVPGIVGCTCYEQKPVKPMGRLESMYYLRLQVADRPGVLASIAYAFGDKEVSLASVLQKHTDGEKAEIVLVTHRVREQNLQDALRLVERLSAVNEISNCIRVEGN
ncbi:homoserine dehydrogenase [Desulfofundulus thermobenzoicus]|uniref:Homoserine dehydrogenase n=1 Tax=Desulfofundulus thermobenzoicus TaxID=29376 RepID=A0A6N7IPS5_9FIRM|nr:homoserine dehydrogenase [Desulfofundulus thermobenzoicus]MQL51579.1 homoserine dehydrogenase [Desulfofundulus thermobenzoicus]